MAWSFSHIPPQHGRSAIVTGTGGLGFETALALARVGAEVVLAGRTPERGAASVKTIRAVAPGARVRFEQLDLASLASVRAFAMRMCDERGSLDLLINNAGVMQPPTRQETADGFELQFGTNHLAHFALTAWLLPLLVQAPAPRVVTVSSGAHRSGRIRFDDLQGERRYSSWAAYGQSKLANLMFMLELQRRSSANGWGIMSNAAHPGFSRTELIANGPGTDSSFAWTARMLRPFFSQSAADGALPTLFAATSPDAQGGGYYGPSGLFEMKGPPKFATIAGQALDRTAQGRLWEISEHLTGARFELPEAWFGVDDAAVISPAA